MTEKISAGTLLPAAESIAAAFAEAAQIELRLSNMVDSQRVAEMAAQPWLDTAFAARRAAAEIMAAQHEENYADPDIHPAEAFNLPGIFDMLGLGVGSVQYMVFFTAQRRSTASEFMLTLADRLAHEEAAGQSGGGLNVYARGELVDIARDNAALLNYARSCCSWDSWWQASQASGLPMHQFAMMQTGQAYVAPDVSTYWAFRTAEDTVELVRPTDLDDRQREIVEEIDCRAREQAMARLALLDA